MKELGVSETVVIRLMSDLYNKGCNVYMDNWCLSFKLFAHLEKNGTVGCETAMKKGFFSAISLCQQPLKLREKVFKGMATCCCRIIRRRKKSISYQQFAKRVIHLQEIDQRMKVQ